MTDVKKGELNWKTEGDPIAAYPYRHCGPQGKTPGNVSVFLERATTPAGLSVYRWAAYDATVCHEFGNPMPDREAAVRAGREHAIECASAALLRAVKAGGIGAL